MGDLPSSSTGAGSIVCVRINWAGTALDYAPPRGVFHTLHVGPEPDHPFGRKGLALATGWQQLTRHLPDTLGMLVMDGDIVIDPADVAAMFRAAVNAPQEVHTAPVRLWPASTKRDDWVWGSWAEKPSQSLDLEPVWFSTCLTYLPARLIKAALKDGLRSWTYPGVDARIAETAQRLGTPVRVVLECQPKHTNY